MDVEYERPTLDTKFEVFSDSSFLKVVDTTGGVGDLRDLVYIKGSIFHITDGAYNFLSNHRLPNSMDGAALFTFNGYKAKVSQLFWHKEIGVVGFPNISIYTNFGDSHLFFHPEYIPSIYPNGHIQIDVYGVGLVNMLLQNILPQCDSVFNRPPPHGRPIRTEEFRVSPTPYYPKKKVFIPLSL